MQTRPCWVEIDTRALEDNYRFLRSLAGSETESLAIVKADAYGHGLTLCGPAAVRSGASWLGVTSVEEGVALRAVCSTARILVMGGVFDGQADAVLSSKLTAVVWDTAQIALLGRAAADAGLAPESVAVHVEIDTGMSRQGVAPGNLTEVLGALAQHPALWMEAVMTHLYASDEANGETSGEQLTRLEDALKRIGESHSSTARKPEFLSVGASAALLGGEAGAITGMADRWNLRPMLRLGLALYGIVPRFDPPFAPGESPDVLKRGMEKLRPVLAWKTRVVSVREIAAGTEVGYNGTFVATEPMKVALLPLGYADGFDRSLSNHFSLLVRGQRAPLVGRVSMDQAVIDVTEVDEVVAGDEVVILGHQGEDTITAFEHADASGTIPWEVFTRIAGRVRRIEVR
jgi:alanine racemase